VKNLNAAIIAGCGYGVAHQKPQTDACGFTGLFCIKI